jgi:hypothetical protein
VSSVVSTLWLTQRCLRIARDSFCLTRPSLLSRGTHKCGGFSNRRLGHRSLPDYRANILTVSFLGVNDVLHHLWNMDSPKFNSVPVLRCSVLSGKRLQPPISEGNC